MLGQIFAYNLIIVSVGPIVVCLYLLFIGALPVGRNRARLARFHNSHQIEIGFTSPSSVCPIQWLCQVDGLGESSGWWWSGRRCCCLLLTLPSPNQSTIGPALVCVFALPIKTLMF